MKKAVDFFSKAIEEDATDHTLYGNRSAAYHGIGEFKKAVQDGNKAIKLKPNWIKGHWRKAKALHGLGKLD